MQKYLDQIICGDCLKILPEIDDNSVDLVFADPPYNVGCSYSLYKDNLVGNEYEEWCKKWFKECRRIANKVIITPGHGVTNGQNNLKMWLNIENPFGIGCWYKPGNPASSVLGWNEWEPWLYYCKDRKIVGGSDTIRATINNQQGIGNHPCPKPLSLLKDLIEKTTKKGQIILDPLAGSGTSLLAAKIKERHYIGIEIDPEYVKTTQRRLDACFDLFDQ